MRPFILSTILALFAVAWTACDAPEPAPSTDPVEDSTTTSTPAPINENSQFKENPNARAMPEDVSGTYIYGDQESSEGGGYLAIKQLEDGRLKFELDLSNGAPSYHSGTITGTMELDGNTAVFTTREFVMQEGQVPCAISFLFQGDQIIVDQEQGSDMSCGFGQGVIADGTFDKQNSSPIFRYEGGR